MHVVKILYIILTISPYVLPSSQHLSTIFHFLLQNYLPLEWGWGVMNFTISCLLTIQMLHTKFCKDWLSSSSKRCYRTTDDARPEWLRWPKNKNLSFFRIFLKMYLWKIPAVTQCLDFSSLIWNIPHSVAWHSTWFAE